MHARIPTALSSLALGALATSAIAAPPAEAWRIEAELRNPESVLHDAERGVLYVSNVAGAPTEKDGVGFISKVAPDGSIVELEWVDGLDAPKGMALDGNTLYVSDIDALVAIDVGTGEITARHVAEGAKFLNDVAVDVEGRVYVSGMVTNRIHRLDGDELTVWVEGEALENPNGLHVEGDRLVVGSWGRMNPDFSTEVPGHMKSISLETGEIASLGSGEPAGNLDGVEPDGAGGYYVTDWVSGGLLHITPAGEVETLLDLDQGSADLEFVEAEGLIVIPMMMSDTLLAYEVAR